MKPKYYIEATDAYYPAGGISDLFGPYNTPEEAIKDPATLRYDNVNLIIVDNNEFRCVGIWDEGKWINPTDWIEKYS